MRPLSTLKALVSALLLLSSESCVFRVYGSEESSDVSSEEIAEFTSNFISKKFNCTFFKDVNERGCSGGSISPYDIGFIGALGDSVSTGYGLLFPGKFNYYGGTFSTGADGSVEDIVTIPNLLKYFNGNLLGGSHGSEPYLNFAATNASCGNLPMQASHFVEELNKQSSKNVNLYWTMVFITIGTDEICFNCSLPNYGALLESIGYIINHIKKVFIVVVGPLLLPYEENQTNPIYERCKCLHGKTKSEVTTMYKLWEAAFSDVEISFISNESFALRAIPVLKPDIENPLSLFISGYPLLSRSGHEFAAVWLWNELFTPKNTTPLSQQQSSPQTIFCPTAECPYFRTPANYKDCNVSSGNSLKFFLKHTTTLHPTVSRRRETLQRHLVLVIVIIIVSAFISVMFFGTIFYRRGLKTTKSRFEAVPGV